MASLQVIKKRFDAAQDADSVALMGYQQFEFGVNPENAASTHRLHTDMNFTVHFHSEGGSECPDQVFSVGKSTGIFRLRKRAACRSTDGTHFSKVGRRRRISTWQVRLILTFGRDGATRSSRISWNGGFLQWTDSGRPESTRLQEKTSP